MKLLAIPLLVNLACIVPTICQRVGLNVDDVERKQQQVPCPKLGERREWRTLSTSDRASWIAGIKCLASLQHERLSFTAQGTTVSGLHSMYDDFAYAHAAMDHTAHVNAYFLPWHRWFLYTFDAALRQDCRYSGPTPYWDWSLDVSDLLSSPIFDPDPVHGLGGSGDPNSDFHVSTGGLSSLSDPPFILSWPVPHALRRNLSLYTGEVKNERPQNATLSPLNIHDVSEQTKGDFFRFQHALTQMHNHVHNFVGGDLAGTCPESVPSDECVGTYTPNEPLFWLHHAQLDRLWSNWQLAHPANYYAFQGYPIDSHNLGDPRYDLNASRAHEMSFDRLSAPVRVSEVFDHTVQPFCYTYAQ